MAEGVAVAIASAGLRERLPRAAATTRSDAARVLRTPAHGGRMLGPGLGLGRLILGITCGGKSTVRPGSGPGGPARATIPLQGVRTHIGRIQPKPLATGVAPNWG
jgi:hypothetical protein